MTLVLVPVLLVTAYLLGLGVGEVVGVTSADLTVVVVVAVGLARGSVAGALTGFCAGLLLDLAPGSTYPVGSGALAGVVAGTLPGLLAELGERRNPLSPHLPPLGRGLLAALVTAIVLLTQGLVRNGIGAVLGADFGSPQMALLLPALGTVLVAGVTLPGLTAVLGIRNRC